jgi:hypothetical protein
MYQREFMESSEMDEEKRANKKKVLGTMDGYIRHRAAYPQLTIHASVVDVGTKSGNVHHHYPHEMH